MAGLIPGRKSLMLIVLYVAMAKKTSSHFLFLCTALNDIRIDIYHKLEADLVNNNLEYFWNLFMSSTIDIKLCCMLGISDDALCLCEALLPIFDRYCKQFLKRAWHVRSSFVNNS